MDHSLDHQLAAENPPAVVDPVVAQQHLASPPQRPVPTAWVWAICGFLLLAVGVVFAQTLGNDFLAFDDDVFVYRNPHVAPGLTLAGIRWAFTSGTMGEWYPLSALSDMLDCQLYGLEPPGHFLTGVLLHAASSVLLFLVLLRMTGDLWPSAWVAAIFAIHPLHVESVAWLAERRDVLSGLFFVLSLGAYTLYAERPTVARYLAILGCLALGLLAKPMLVTVPCLLLLLDYWPLRRFGRSNIWRLLAEKIPLFVLAALSAAMALTTHSSMRGEGVSFERFPLATRLGNAVVSCAAYVRQSFFPIDMVPYYPHPGPGLPLSSVVGSLVLLVVITALALLLWRRAPYLIVGWFWFLGMLVPVLGLLQFAIHGRADRYTYLSQIGLSIAVAWGAWNLCQSRQTFPAARWKGWLLAIASAAVVLLLMVVACRQTSYWRNAKTLWTHTLACDPNNSMAHYFRGLQCAEQGDADEAAAHFRAVLANCRYDSYLIEEAHGHLAKVLTQQGNVDEAIEELEQGVRAFPHILGPHHRLAVALARHGDYERAISEWRESARLAPNSLAPLLGLADALLAGGHAAEAAAQCQEILKKQPEAIQAMVMLGEALADQGDVEGAIGQLQSAVDFDPQDDRAQIRLGLILCQHGQARRGVTHLNQAVRIQPDNLKLLRQTAWILATDPDPSARDGARAVELARRLVDRSRADDASALDVLAAALAETQQFAAAVDAADRASTRALAQGDAELADAITARMRLYRRGVPFREEPWAAPAADVPAVKE